MNNFYQISDLTKSKVLDLIDKNKLSIVDGDLLVEFENKASSFFGHRYGVATCNGTSAIHLAYFAIGIEAGDEVIMPTYAFHAMVTPLFQLGGKPIFCDVDENTLTLDVRDVEKKITSNTKAIMVLHPWGNVANIDELVNLAKRHNLLLISDSSHAHGAKWKEKNLGEYFDILCASFGKGKLITGGELGIVTTDNPGFRDRMLLFSHVNRVPGAYITEKYKNINNAIGIKYRPHPLALQIALNQIGTFDDRNQNLQNNIFELIEEINRNPKIKIQKSFSLAKRVFWKIVLISDETIIKIIQKKATESNLQFEENHYSTLLNEDSIIIDYYGIRQTNFLTAESLKNKIIQIDAIQLFERDITKKYIKFFRELREQIS